MKKNILIVLLFLLIFIPALSFAQMLPFGGQVESIQVCNNGLLVWVLTPMTGLIPFMWMYGNLPYLMNIPPHPGQYVLGMAGVVSPCTLGYSYIGQGATILFHGSSL